MNGAYDAFISYNRRDRDAVHRIALALEARRLSVFLDAWRLEPGARWPELLEEALGRCASVVVVIGPQGLSGWQRREAFLALERQNAEPGFPVIPTLLPGADDPALGFLGLNTWVDLRSGLDDGAAFDALVGGARRRAPGAPGEARPDPRPDPRDEVCPYRGLEPFREEDAPFFFGREAFAERLVARVRERRFVAVVGASGSGKSSVVRAGLCPALRRGVDGHVWDVLTMRPGASPVSALAQCLDPPPPELGLTAARARANAAAASLRRGGVKLSELARDHLARQPGTERLLLVVDQLEEAATLSADPAERSDFIDMLLEATAATGPLTVVATLRSDFYSEIASRRDLMERLEGGVVNVGPLSRESGGGGRSEIERIVRNPAEAVGLRFEDGLVDRILGEVGDAPGDLPLLEYLLTELWRRREGGRLTHAAHNAIGGVKGAVASRAEEAFAALSEAEQAAAKRVFLSLVRPGDGHDDTRARAAYPEDPAEAAMVDRFAGRRLRLLVVGEDAAGERFVDLGHEVLIRGWARLEGWIERHRARLRILDRVRARRRRWRAEGRIDDLLLPRGLELEEGRALLDAADEIAVAEVRDYVAASLAADAALAEAAAQREAAAAARAAASRRRARLIFGGAALVSLALLVAAAWQWRGREFAREAAAAQAAAADELQRLAEARDLARIARSALDENPGETAVAAMIAVDSLAKRPGPEAAGVLRDALARAPLGAELAPTPWSGATAAISRDGGTVALAKLGASSAVMGQASILALGADHSVAFARDFAADVAPVLSPDGRWLANSGFDRRLVVLDRRSGEAVLDRPTRGGVFTAFSPDGGRLYAAVQTGEILRYDTSTWAELPPFAFPVAGARDDRIELAVSPDGARLTLVDVRIGVHEISAADGAATTLPFGPNREPDPFLERFPIGVAAIPQGDRAILFDNKGGGAIWDASEARVVATFDDGSKAWSAPRAIAFDLPGGRFVRAAFNGDVTIRSLETGEETGRFEHGGQAYAAMIAGEPARLVVAGDGGATIWSLEGDALARCATEATVTSMARVAGGGAILLGGEDGRLSRCDPGSGAVTPARRFDRPIIEMDGTAPDGALAITLSDRGYRSTWSEIAIFERETGRERARLLWPDGLTDLSISPDGNLIAARNWDRGAAYVWDSRTTDLLRKIETRGGIAGFSPDGRRLHLNERALSSVDLATGARLSEMGEAGGVSDFVAATGDGTLITRGYADGAYELRGWSLETGAPLWRRPDPGLISREADLYARYEQEASDLGVHAFPDGARIGGFALEALLVEAALFSADRSRLAVVAHRRTAEGRVAPVPLLHDLRGGAAAREVGDAQFAFPLAIAPISAERFAVIGPALAGRRREDGLAVARWSDGAIVWSERLPGVSRATVRADPAGARLLIGSSAGLALRDAATGATIWTRAAERFSAATFSPDGARILLGRQDADGQARLAVLDAGDGRTLFERPLGAPARDIAVDAAGERIVLALASGNRFAVEVRRAEDAALLHERVLDAEPKALLVPPVGDGYVVLDRLGAARLYALGDGRERVGFMHSRHADETALAEGAPRAATSAMAIVRYWDSGAGAERARMRAEGDVSALAISPDGARVAYLAERAETANAAPNSRRMWVWRPGGPEPPASIAADGARDIAFDPTGETIAISGANGAFVRFVEADTLATRLTATPLAKGALQEAGPSRPVFTPDGRFAALVEKADYGQSNGRVSRRGLRVFDLVAGRETKRFDIGDRGGPVGAPGGFFYHAVDGRLRWLAAAGTALDAVIEPDLVDDILPLPGASRLAFVDYWDGDRLIDFETGGTIPFPAGEGVASIAGAVDPAGRFLALCRRSRDAEPEAPGSVAIFDLGSGARLAERNDLPRACGRAAFVDGGAAVMLSVASGREAAQGSREWGLYSWRWGEDRLEAVVADNPVNRFALSGDRSVMATFEGGADESTGEISGARRIRVWDVATRTPTLTAPGEGFTPLLRIGSEPVAAVMSADGRRLAMFGTSSPSRGEVIEIGAAGGPRRLLTVEREDGAFWGRPVGFTPDGRTFILGVASGARLYDLDGGGERRLREADRAKNYALSADGAFLAIAGETFLSVWSVARGEALARIPTAETVWPIFGGKDGADLIVSGGREIRRIVWRSEALARMACQVYEADDWWSGRARLTDEAEPPPCARPASAPRR